MKKIIAMLAASVSFIAVPSLSFAALSAADVTTVTSGVTADANTLFAPVLAVVGLILGMSISIKLIKRFVRQV